MSLDDVAQLISERLPTGLPHPGLPDDKTLQADRPGRMGEARPLTVG